VDICFVVDYSGSIRDTNPPGVDNWQLVINFMVRVVSDINIGPTTTHVCAVSFGITALDVSNYCRQSQYECTNVQ